MYSNNYTALIAASRYGYAEIVKLLLTNELIKHKVDINTIWTGSSDDYHTRSRTALMFAAENGHNEVIKLLLEQPNIRLDFFDEEAYNAVMLASKNCHPKALTSLLNHKTCSKEIINNLSEYQTTALMEACVYGHTEIVRILLNHENTIDQIDIGIIDDVGQTAELIAKENEYGEIIKLFHEFKKYKLQKKSNKQRTIAKKAVGSIKASNIA